MKYLFIFTTLLLLPYSVFALVDINTASLKQLETLTGIGPIKAQAIIEARPFSSLDGLLKVKGIGEKTLEKIKTQGLAYVDPSYKKEEKPEPIKIKTPINTISAQNIEAKADIPEIRNKNSTYLIALILAILSGTAILILKKNIS